MHSLLFDPALVGRLKQFLISIAIHLKSAKKRSCLIFTLITSFMLKNSTPFYHLMIYSLRRLTRYRKIPKISPEAYICQRPLLKGLSTEGICVSKSIGLALYLEGNLPFLLCFTLHLGAISKYKPPGGLYLDGRFNGGYLGLPV